VSAVRASRGCHDEPMNDVVLREAGPADSEFAYRTKKAAFREYVEKVWGWDEEVQRRFHEQGFRWRNCRIINVASTDVGTMNVVTTPDGVTVNQIFVLPEHQGRGIGRKCMLLVMEEARQLGLPVRLRVLKVNPRAEAFYERLGFRRTAETDTHVLMEKDSSEAGGCER
jgi:GNAT superfamily N-acetyltransferase